MKVEFDLPEFEKELSINIIIRKDGEVVLSTSSSSDNLTNVPKVIPLSTKKEEKQNEDIPPTTPIKSVQEKSSGNMMDADIF